MLQLPVAGLVYLLQFSRGLGQFFLGLAVSRHLANLKAI
jgi:hypothetical protein